MRCSRCNAEIPAGIIFCPTCGAPVGGQEKKASVGLAVLSFFIPLVGLILYIVKKDSEPKTAKLSGKCALISVILSVVLSVFISFGALWLPYFILDEAGVFDEFAQDNESDTVFVDRLSDGLYPGDKFIYAIDNIKVSFDDAQVIPVKGNGQTFWNYQVVFTVTNNGEKDYNVSFDDFIVEVNGRMDNSNLAISPSLNLRDPIAPGESATYTATFAVYVEAEEVHLIWQNNDSHYFNFIV